MSRLRIDRAIAAGLVLLLGTGPVAGQVRVHFWAKAFIPKSHPQLPSYIHDTKRGQYVLPAPLSPIPGSDIGKLSGTCFATDNRRFSSDPTASARVTTEIVLVIDGRNVSLEKAAGRDFVRIGKTENVDCVSGDSLQPPKSAFASSVSIGEVKNADFFRTLNIRASSPNPFYTMVGIGVAPDIDFELVLRYDIIFRTLTVTGSVGDFPSFEAYYAVDNGSPLAVVTLDPEGKSTATSLFDFGVGLNMRRFEKTLQVVR